MPFFSTTINYLMGSNPVWFFIDETGLVATGATMGTFSGSNHATQKAVYQNPDGTGPYPNPIPLNTTGAAPLYFADDDPNGYYLEVKDSLGNVLWTIDKYIPPESGGGGGGGGITINNAVNFLVNPQFQFNYGLQGASATPPVTNFGSPSPVAIAQGPWSFTKGGTNGSDSVSFPLFSLGDTTPEGTPVNYINLVTTSVGVSETYRYLEYFFKNVRTFEQQTVIAQFWGMTDIPGSSVSVKITQYFGSGGSPHTDVDTILGNQSFILSSNWTSYSTSGVLPSTQGMQLGTNGDDGVYFRISLPVNRVYQASLVNMQFRLGNQPINFVTNPENLDVSTTIASQIPDPKNGANDLSEIGSVLTVVQNGLSWGPIDNVGEMTFFAGPKAKIKSNKTYCDGTRYDTQAKFSDSISCQRLFDIIDINWGNGYDYLWCNSNGTNIIEVMNAAPGEVTHAANGTSSPGFTYDVKVDGIADGYGLKHVYYLQTNTYFGIWTQVNCTVTLPSNTAEQLGALSTYADATSLSEGLYAITLSGSTATLNDQYFMFQKPGTTYVVWINYNGTGTPPSVPSTTNIEVDVTTTDTLHDVTLKIVAKIRGAELTYITTQPASAITGGDYFLIEASGQKIAPWYSKDGVGAAPVVTDYTAIEIDITGIDTNSEVATKTQDSINKRYYQVPDGRGGIPMGLPDGSGIDPGVASRFSFTNPTVTGDNIGTYQFDQNRSHNHDFNPSNPNTTHVLTDEAPPNATINESGSAYRTQLIPLDGQARSTPYNFGGYWVIAH